MEEIKERFCNIAIGLPANELHKLIREYVTKYKVSSKIENFFINLLSEVI